MAPPEVFMKEEEWRLEISVSAYGKLFGVVAANPVVQCVVGRPTNVPCCDEESGLRAAENESFEPDVVAATPVPVCTM